jgi:hypothetical protein
MRYLMYALLTGALLFGNPACLGITSPNAPPAPTPIPPVFAPSTPVAAPSATPVAAAPLANIGESVTGARWKYTVTKTDRDKTVK